MKCSIAFLRPGNALRWVPLVAALLVWTCTLALPFHAAGGQDSRSILSAAAAGVGLPPADHDFTRLSPGQDFTPNHLLVRFASGVESAQRAQILNTLGGAQIAREYQLVPGLCLVTLPAGQTVQQALQSYNGTSGILYAEPNYLVHADATVPNDPLFPELWGMRNTGQTGGTPGADIHATEAWDFTTGSRQVVVAVIDTGVDYTHPDLVNNIWTNPGEIPGNGVDDDGNGYVDDVHGYDFANNDGDPMDDDDHGTHCAGTIGGEGNNNIGVAGVCWQVRIMAVKFLGLFGGSTADAISSVQYATLMGAKVMNNSWGGGGFTQALKDAIDAAGAAGIIFPAAAGNSGTDNDVIPQYPASYTSANIVAVMSTDHNDVRSDFSCFGLTSVDLAAPGSDILSCRPGGGYQLMSGTSMATPHVTGACALLLAANPALSVADLKQALLSTVDPVVPGLCVSGGRLNLSRALTSLLPQSPLVVYTNYLFHGNGNGIVEFNECNSLNLILANMSAANVTGISVTLATTTPEVAIAQPTSSYPDIPAGATATNFVPFKMSTSPSFICGTTIECVLAVRSDSGLSLLQFSLPTGVPGAPLRFDNNSLITIPSPGAASSSILVSNVNFAVQKVTVSMFVEESFDYFLKLELIAPDGTTNLLSANNGLFGQNYGLACSPDSQRTTFDDAALVPISAGSAPFVGSFKPSKSLSVFSGKSGTNVNGIWRLRATDEGRFDTAAIHCWSLSITPTLCVDGGGQCPGADLAVGMTAQPNPVITGNNLTFDIAVTNLGPSTTTNVIVTHLLPTNVTVVSASALQGSYSQSGNVVTFNLGSLSPRATTAMAVVGLATAAGTGVSAAVASSEQPDYASGNNSARVTTVVRPATADLAVAIAAVPNPVLIGGALTYNVSVTNNGPSPASSISVTNALPFTAQIQSATVSTGTVSTVGNVIIWSVTNLAMGASATATITVTPTAEGIITATATAGAREFDPITPNNTATVSTTVGPAADLALGLTGFPDTVVAGNNVTYGITVTNLGPSVATGVIVNDSLPASINVLSTNGSQGTISISNNFLIWNLGTVAGGAKATLTIVARTTTNTTLISAATVTAAQTDPNTANNSATVTTQVGPAGVAIAAAGATLITESFFPPNGAIDIGETVTIILRLRNSSNVTTLNLVGTLLATNGVAPSSPTSQTYGVLAPSGFPVGRAFTFTASGTNGQTIYPTLQLQDGTSTYPPVSFAFTLPTTQVFADTNTILIPDPAAPHPLYPVESGPAKPYPSVINVAGFTGVLGRVAVTLSNLSHTYPGDVNVLLVAPSGARTLLMSHAGDQPATGLKLTFDDSAPAPLPATGQFGSGVWQPAAYSPAPSFPTNAPAGPYPSALSALTGGNANGPWLLYVFDDSGGDVGSISNGWRLALTSIAPVNQLADLGLTGVAEPSSGLVGGTLTYIFTITNAGPNTANSVAFTNVLPAGVTLVSAGTSQGSVFTTPTNVIVNLETLNAGATATVTSQVTVTTTALPQGVTNGTVTSVANVAANETDLNPGNNAIAVVTTVNRPVADLVLAQAVAPDPVVVGYSLTNTVVITNRGPGTAVSVVLTEPLPPGAGLITASSGSTVGTITATDGAVTCALGDLASNATATVIIVLTNSAPGLMTNAVSLSSGSYDPNTNNNRATYVATVNNPAPVIINSGAVLTYESGPFNGAVDPGETVAVSLALANIGSLDTVNLKATLQASGGVTPLSGPQNYGTLIFGGPAAARSFSFTAAAVPGATVATLQLQDERLSVTNNLGTVVFTFYSPVTTTLLSSAPIIIPNKGVGTPYPSVINVSGLTGRVSQVTVALKGLSHTFPHDINVLLVSPSGSNVLVMSRTGGGHPVTNINLTFSDAATGTLPNYDPITAGTNKPSSYEGLVALPGTVPSRYQFALSGMIWSNPNGAWSLYVYDDSSGDSGVIAGGWSLNLTTLVTVGPVVDLAVGVTAPSALEVVGTMTNTFNITNFGPDPASGVVLTNPLPAGVSLVSAGTSQGTVLATPTSLIANLGTLNLGASATVTSVVMVTTAAIPPGAAKGTLTSVAYVAANEEDLYPANNSAAVVTTVSRPVVDLGLTQTVAPDPVFVDYSLTNTVVITNRGPGAALEVVLTEPVPPGAGFIAASSSSTIGTITETNGAVTCALGDLAANASATVTIVLTNAAPGLMTNTAYLSTGSYDSSTNDNSATYVATVVSRAPQIIAAGAALTYESGPINGAVDPGETVTLSLAVANVGSLDTVNLKAALEESGGVTSPNGPQNYGTLIYGGAAAARSFSFTAAAVLGGATVATLQLQDERPGVTNNLGTVAFTFYSPATTSLLSAAPITILDDHAATPYPSTINVSGLAGRVSKVTIALNGLTHTYPHDVNVLLVSPSGSNVLVMSHTGGGQPVTNINLTFDDAAPAYLPNSDPLTTGTYKPTSYEGPVDLPGPAPSGPYQSALSGMTWTQPNGAWSLYVSDDSLFGNGVIADGWSLNLSTIVTVGPVIDLAVGLTVPISLEVGSTLTNTITITNFGPDPATGVMLTNPLPAGVQFVSASLSQGNLTGTGGGLVSCNLGSLAAGGSANVIIVTKPSLPGLLVNSVSVAASEEDLNPANNTAQATTAVSGPAVLSGSFSGGQFQLTVIAEPNYEYEVLASTDLITWVSLSTNTNTTGTFIFIDTTTPAPEQRFYRTLRR